MIIMCRPMPPDRLVVVDSETQEVAWRRSQVIIVMMMMMTTMRITMVEMIVMMTLMMMMMIMMFMISRSYQVHMIMIISTVRCS